ncbi:MAG: hypothetical protein LQ337_007859 [Flavoplaca oasis]|nr:MAG: hypothetical protein LQ337_007859 [Flavoplaca oasis]
MDHAEAKDWVEAGAVWCDDDEDQPKRRHNCQDDQSRTRLSMPTRVLADRKSRRSTSSGPREERQEQTSQGWRRLLGDSQGSAVKNIEEFCTQGSKSLEYNQDSVDHLRLSVELSSDGTKGPADVPNCRDNFVNAVIDGCDGNDVIHNPHNYKFGATLTLADGWVPRWNHSPNKFNGLSFEVAYKLLFNGCEIRGRNRPDAKLGANGEGLGSELNWKFEWTPDDANFQW